MYIRSVRLIVWSARVIGTGHHANGEVCCELIRPTGCQGRSAAALQRRCICRIQAHASRILSNNFHPHFSVHGRNHTYTGRTCTPVLNRLILLQYWLFGSHTGLHKCPVTSDTFLGITLHMSKNARSVCPACTTPRGSGFFLAIYKHWGLVGITEDHWVTCS